MGCDRGKRSTRPLFDVRATPLFRQFAADGGSEDRLAEAFEDCRQGVEAALEGVHLRQQGIQAGGNLLLFSERGERDLMSFDQSLRYIWLSSPFPFRNEPVLLIPE